MSAAIKLLEHLPLLAMVVVFIFIAVPAGWAAISGFFGIMGAFARGEEADKHGEVKVGRVSFKGPIRLGLITLAIIFALIALYAAGNNDHYRSNGNLVTSTHFQRGDFDRYPYQGDFNRYP